jgi:tetratricopeptide (TPR) repeat protein
LIALAGLASWMGDRDVAKRAAEQALSFHRAHGDAWRIGDDVHTLGIIAAESDDWETARGHFEESVRLLREAGDEDYALWCVRSVGWTYHDTGDLARAREIHEANLLRAREIGNRAIEGTTLGVLGTILVAEGRAPESFPSIEQAYRLHRQVDQPVEASVDLWRFAEALAAVDRAEEAVELTSLSVALREELGASVPWVDRKTGEMLEDLRGRLDPAAFERAWERGKRLTPDDAVAIAIHSAEPRA